MVSAQRLFHIRWTCQNNFCQDLIDILTTRPRSNKIRARNLQYFIIEMDLPSQLTYMKLPLDLDCWAWILIPVVANFMSLLTKKCIWIWSHYAFEVANCKNPAASGSLIKLHDGPCEELLPIVEAVEAEDEGNCPIFCTQEWRPVCGTDGK